jgi:hypothetical protein
MNAKSLFPFSLRIEGKDLFEASRSANAVIWGDNA